MKTNTLSDTERYIQCKGNVVSDMDGEKVMLNVEKGKYYNLGEVGGGIWDLLNEPRTFSEIVDGLMAEYDIDRMKCEHQVAEFMTQLLAEGLIEIG